MGKRRLSALATFREKVAEMEAKGMKAGGEPGDCCCGCNYEGRGGSSTAMNDAANDAGGKKSPGCEKRKRVKKNIVGRTELV